LDTQGQPLLAVSVTAIIDRMPAQRQREIAGWIKSELARLAVQA
ncbi:MAG: IclR family transcriptional regulator, partial [Achromobacter kerstersii]